MGAIGFAFCTALAIDPGRGDSKMTVVKRLFDETVTGHPVKDRILAAIHRLGGTVLVNPRTLSVRELIMELVRTLKVRAMPVDRRSLTLLVQGSPQDPVDRLTFAIFGTY